jgi:hypothetical protein
MSRDENMDKCFCNSCRRLTFHLIVHSHSQSGTEDEVPLSWENAYQILECQGCHNVTYRTREWCSEWADETGSNYNYIYYPPLVAREKPSWFKHLPKPLYAVLFEVYISLHAGIRYLSSVGARTALDVLIVDTIGDVGTFAQKLAKLETDGHITAPERALIEAVTETGNASAHRGFAPDEQSLNSVMDILESIIYKFYIAEKVQDQLLDQAAALRKRIPPRR